MSDYHGFVPAVHDIRCRDEWPMGALRDTVLPAYKLLHDAEQITIQFPLVFFPDCLVIAYLSPIPVDWARDALRKAEREIVCGVGAEQVQMMV